MEEKRPYAGAGTGTRSIRRLAIAAAATAMMIGTVLPAAQAGSVEATPGIGSSAATVAPAGAPTGIRWRKVAVPNASLAMEAHDVISTGFGFLAVGGGTADSSKAPRARIWTSTTGREWRSVPLKGPARKGLIVAVTETRRGFVAVGYRQCCPLRALVWLSPDAKTWRRLPSAKIFEGALMRDVTVRGKDIIAVGCVAEFHCSFGRVWRSRDGGRSWKVLSEPPIMFEGIAATSEGYLGVGTTTGFDDGRAVTATSPDGVRWTVASPAKLGSNWAVDRRRERLLVAGGTRTPSGDFGRATLGATRDGDSWKTFQSKAFRGARLIAVDAVKSLTVLAGMRVDADDIVKPYTYVTSDLKTFARSSLPTGAADLAGSLRGVAISPDRKHVVAVGNTWDNRPAIWFGKIRR